MKKSILISKISLIFFCLVVLFANLSQGQIDEESKVLVSKSIFGKKKLIIENGDLSKINNANYLVGKYNFENLHIVKTESSHYYLIAEDQNSDQIFAFELIKMGRNLFSSKYQEMHVCSEENNGINTFLLNQGKITGCQLGNHTISVGGTPPHKNGK